MKLLSVIRATKSNRRLWALALAGILLSSATFDSFAQSLPQLMHSASGDYFIDGTVNNELVKSPTPYIFTTTKNIDIEGGKDTKADLSANNIVTSNINSKDDHDWFRVHLDAGKTYGFEAVSKNPSDKLFVHLGLKTYDGLTNIANPRNVVDSMDNTGNVHSKMTLSPVASDTYYIDVYGMTSAKIPSCSGDYTLSYKVI